jgi:geranylgeranyl diphosphate synthase type II
MFLEPYRMRFEKELRSSIEQMGSKNRLRDACEYSLLCGGKRLRPLLVLMTAEAIGKGFNVMPAALSAEFFHTASLIADDLPSMDNDDFRRGRPSLHKTFGESVAILASYTLIAEGYGGIYKNQELLEKEDGCFFLSKEAALLSLKIATRCGGMHGATNGQYLDLFPPDFSWETVSQVIIQKTVTLFQLSLSFGWLFGGGDIDKIGEVEECGYHLGMAFQIADDLDDVVQDLRVQSQMSAIKSVGRERAEKIFEEELVLFRQSLEKLGLWTEPFQELYASLDRSRGLFNNFRSAICIPC